MTFQKILSFDDHCDSSIHWSDKTPTDVIHLVQQLLMKDWSDRLGMIDNVRRDENQHYVSIRSHPFLSHINWKDLESGVASDSTFCNDYCSQELTTKEEMLDGAELDFDFFS